MSDDVQYTANWPEVATQCQNCKNYQAKNGKHGCVPADMTFEEAVAEYGEVDPGGHCNHFEPKQ